MWDKLWQQATAALQSADRVVTCGYSLLTVDERARKLLLNVPKKDAEIVIASGNDSVRIVGEYREAGYANVAQADEVVFRKWVEIGSNGTIVTR